MIHVFQEGVAMRILALIVFGFIILGGVAALASPDSPTKLAFALEGVEWLFYLLSVVVILAAIAAIVCLLAKPSLFRSVGGLALAAYAIGSIVMIVVVSRHQDEFNAQYLKSRQARGMTIRPAQRRAMEGAGGIMIPLAMTAIVMLLGALAVAKVPAEDPSTPQAVPPDHRKRGEDPRLMRR